MTRTRVLLTAGVLLIGIAAFAAFKARPSTPKFYERPRPTKLDKSFYGWLAFGPNAATKTLLRFDGDATYLSHDAGKTFESSPVQYGGVDHWFSHGGWIVVGENDDSNYEVHSLNIDKRGGEWVVAVFVRVRGPSDYDQSGSLRLHATQQTAPEAHFNGPLILHLAEESQFKFTKGEEEDLTVYVGTVDRAKGCWVAVNNSIRAEETFPEGVRPAAEISFPRADGGPPIQQRIVLTEMC